MAVAKRAKEELASREEALRAQLTQDRDRQLQVALSIQMLLSNLQCPAIHACICNQLGKKPWPAAQLDSEDFEEHPHILGYHLV